MFGGRLGIPELLVLLVLAAFVWGWAKIFSKAGYPALLCLLMFVPFVNLIVFFWFAFSSWPGQRTLPDGLYSKDAIRNHDIGAAGS